MDKKKYEIVSIAIDKQGRWFYDEGRGCCWIEPELKSNFTIC